MERNLEEIASAIRAARTVAICSHVNPDGDTVGTGLALRLGLERLGIQVSLFDQDKVPDMLHILPGHELYRSAESIGEDERFDLLLNVDVSDESRMGACRVLMQHADHNAQIDHHGTNPEYCELNTVDGTASAVALVGYDLLKALHVELNREIAMCLYAAISTDTGNFAYGNTTGEAFHVMAELMQYDLPLSEMNRTLFMEKSVAQIRLLQRALATLTFSADNQVTSMKLTMKDFEDCGALPEHADTIVNYGLSISGVKMAVLARETLTGIKMSLRSLAPVSVSGVATRFGGGGHNQASGCTMQGTLDECTARVVEAMCEALD